MKLTIEHLAPYFPYGLKGFSREENLGVELVKGYSTYGKNNHINLVTNVDEIDIEMFQPLLRPLSDLTKEIEHNGERFVPASKMITHGFHHEFWNEDKFDYRYLYALDYQKLLSWHFNIFKLPETLYIKYSDIT